MERHLICFYYLSPTPRNVSIGNTITKLFDIFKQIFEKTTLTWNFIKFLIILKSFKFQLDKTSHITKFLNSSLRKTGTLNIPLVYTMRNERKFPKFSTSLLLQENFLFESHFSYWWSSIVVAQLPRAFYKELLISFWIS